MKEQQEINCIEKAIENLRIIRDCKSIYSSIFKERYGKSLEIAISALEKQLPKAPLFEDNGGYPEYFEHWLACPVCDEAIPEYTSENETECYCLNCGQKLKWED